VTDSPSRLPRRADSYRETGLVVGDTLSANARPLALTPLSKWCGSTIAHASIDHAEFPDLEVGHVAGEGASAKQETSDVQEFSLHGGSNRGDPIKPASNPPGRQPGRLHRS